MSIRELKALKNICDTQYVLIVLIFFVCVIVFFWIFLPVLLILLGFIQLVSAIYFMKKEKERGSNTNMFKRYFQLCGIWVLIQACVTSAGSLGVSAIVAVFTSQALAIWVYLKFSEMKSMAEIKLKTQIA